MSDAEARTPEGGRANMKAELPDTTPSGSAEGNQAVAVPAISAALSLGLKDQVEQYFRKAGVILGAGSHPLRT